MREGVVPESLADWWQGGAECWDGGGPGRRAGFRSIQNKTKLKKLKQRTAFHLQMCQFSSIKFKSSSVQSLSNTACCAASRSSASSSPSSSSSSSSRHSSSLSLSGPMLVLPRHSAGEQEPRKSAMKASMPMQTSPPQTSLPPRSRHCGSMLRVCGKHRKKVKKFTIKLMVSTCYRYSVLLIVKTNKFFSKTNQNLFLNKKKIKKKIGQYLTTLIYLLIIYLIKSNKSPISETLMQP